jgi:flavin-dependent dehydrogenase
MPRMMLHSAQAELPADEPGEVEVHFGSSVAPRGFAWAVPVLRERPCVRVGVMCEGDPSRHFSRMLDAIADRWRIDRGARFQPRQKVLPLAPLERVRGPRRLPSATPPVVTDDCGRQHYYSLLSAARAAER